MLLSEGSNKGFFKTRDTCRRERCRKIKDENLEGHPVECRQVSPTNGHSDHSATVVSDQL
jgi:hypothetical protein